MSHIEHPMLLRVPPDVASVLRDTCSSTSSFTKNGSSIGIEIHPDHETFTLQISNHQDSTSFSSSLSRTDMNREGDESIRTSSSSSSSSSTAVHKLKGKIAHTATYVDASKPFSNDNIAQAQSISRILLVQEHIEPLSEPVSSSTVPNPNYYQTTNDPTPGSQLNVATSGITPPLRDIVRKQHVPSWKYINRYSTDEITETERTLVDLIHNTDVPKYEHVVEELVDAEAFMAGWFRGEGATDNATLVYENGILKDVYSMDKGKLTKRHGTGALLRLPNANNSSSSTSSTTGTTKGSGLILSFRTSSSTGGISNGGLSSTVTNGTMNAAVTDTDVQALMNAYSEGDLILGGLNDDDDDEDEGDYYNDDDEDDGINEGLDDEEENTTANLHLPSSSSSSSSFSSSSAGVPPSTTIINDEPELPLQSMNEELDLVDNENMEEGTTTADIVMDEEQGPVTQDDKVPAVQEDEEVTVIDPRIQATEEALQRAKEELATAQKQLHGAIAAFRARAANTVARVQAEVDRLEKELVELKGGQQ